MTTQMHIRTGVIYAKGATVPRDLLLNKKSRSRSLFVFLICVYVRTTANGHCHSVNAFSDQFYFVSQAIKTILFCPEMCKVFDIFQLSTLTFVKRWTDFSSQKCCWQTILRKFFRENVEKFVWENHFLR